MLVNICVTNSLTKFFFLALCVPAIPPSREKILNFSLDDTVCFADLGNLTYVICYGGLVEGLKQFLLLKKVRYNIGHIGQE